MTSRIRDGWRLAFPSLLQESREGVSIVRDGARRKFPSPLREGREGVSIIRAARQEVSDMEGSPTTTRLLRRVYRLALPLAVSAALLAPTPAMAANPPTGVVSN